MIYALAIALALTSTANAAKPPRPVGRINIAGIVTDSRLSELSGLAASQRMADRYWAINDGGNGSKLLLIDGRGRVHSEVQVDVANVDWEALASFRWRGQAWLLIADTGNNDGRREYLDLWLLKEPDPRQPPAAVDHERNLAVRFPDEPHDVEALSVDAVEGQILLLTKRTVPSVLYRVPLDGIGKTTATKVAPLPGIPQPTPAEIRRDGALSRYRSQTTEMQLDCARTSLLVLTYDSIYRFVRRSDQSWEEALTDAEPSRSQITFLPQAEAMAFDETCTQVFVGSEKTPSPLLRFRYRPLP